MTREEREKAIDLLDNLLGMVEDNQDNDYDKALRMGIESLRKEPCEDAVSRKAIEEMLNARGQGSVITFDHFIELLYKLPSVEPTRKKGKWIYDIESEDWSLDLPFKCSNCKCRFIKSKYCPNCGAEMEVE